MTSKSKKPKPKKRGGAPKGNKNSLKHGFYSKAFTAEQKKYLNEIEATDVTSEINAMRVLLSQLMEQISFDAIMFTDDKGRESRDSHYLTQLGVITAMSANIGQHVRTFFLTKGKTGDIAQGILEAIAALDPYKEL